MSAIRQSGQRGDGHKVTLMAETYAAIVPFTMTVGVAKVGLETGLPAGATEVNCFGVMIQAGHGNGAETVYVGTPTFPAVWELTAGENITIPIDGVDKLAIRGTAAGLTVNGFVLR